ncbi:dGTP triphosphohydrolase, partial [Microbacterium lacticum]|uniref:dGTP triphosphohydrolase n=2 Tax=Microbacterium lacticum TaxID=33885 RepID=UPI001669DF41
MDADRLLYSPELRRLAGVTQVISPQDDYVFHDRLTHSLKVAQVAQRLAQELRYRHKGVWKEDVLSSVLDPDVCYVAGLSHDLGHPPFGHAAEVQLQDLLAPTVGDEVLADSFEGNAQSFRIATRLSFRKQIDDTTLAGLNLTWRSLAAISKYPWPKGGHPADQAKLAKKWGFYNTERKFYEHMLETGLIHPYGPDSPVKQNLEAQVMDWADDVAYAVHDLEDFFRAGRVPLDRLSRSGNNAGGSGGPSCSSHG